MRTLKQTNGSDFVHPVVKRHNTSIEGEEEKVISNNVLRIMYPTSIF